MVTTISAIFVTMTQFFVYGTSVSTIIFTFRFYNNFNILLLNINLKTNLHQHKMDVDVRTQNYTEHVLGMDEEATV